MAVKHSRVSRGSGIQFKMLVIILPLIALPMLILAAVGFMTANREASKSSARYLAQREADLHTIAENPAIRDFFNNRFYGLDEEADVYRRELGYSLKRFAERSNSIELIYKKNTRSVFPSLFKKITYTACSNTNKHLDEI